MTSVETSAKAPEEKEEPDTADQRDLNAEMKPDQRRSKRRRSSPVTPTDKPRTRKKTKMTKKGMIDLSDEEPQEAKREEETVYAEGTLQAPETDDINNFKKSMAYGEQVVVPIL
ncbi:hypothetical protein R1flu_022288 [Riccia fluitans]|uniref:Uncharacterized protein n=1 Tax=Riccia fluitans TaxID=41844 RepID=A0ABD1ZS30_9MARC